MAKFKQEILDKIKADADLFGVVAKEMRVRPISLGKILDRNGNTLNNYAVVQAVAKYLRTRASELVEEVSVESTRN